MTALAPDLVDIKKRIEGSLQKRKSIGVGSILSGKWKLVKFLGSGATSDTFLGRSDVFMARRQQSDEQHRFAAIKIYKSWVLERKNQVDRLIREATTMKNLDHPNLMKILGLEVDEINNVVYSELEYLNGKTLTIFVDENRGSLEYDMILDLLGQLSEAVGELHRVGIVHRDIKPDNIMVLKRRGHLTLKLMDFGVIKKPGTVPFTSEGEFLGTLRYAAPEWILGRGSNPLVDIYSIGATLYKMLTKKEPYHEVGNNKNAVVLASRSKELFPERKPKIDTIRSSEQLQFLSCLGAWLTSKSPGRRPKNLAILKATVKLGTNSRWWLRIVNDEERTYCREALAAAYHKVHDYPVVDWYSDFECAGIILERAASKVKSRYRRRVLASRAIDYLRDVRTADGTETIGTEEEISKYLASIDSKIATLRSNLK